MRAWKKSILAASVLLAVVAVQADETKTAKKKHLVDMADGLNQQEFYSTKNPDAIWSSDGQAPWSKSEAVNAYEQTESKPATAAAVKREAAEIPATTAARPTAAPVMENGKPVEAGRAINIRVRYTLDPEHSRASFSPVSAQNELYRQMSSHCGNGFQKMSEWSTPVEGADYYLYYQFRCMDAESKTP